MFLNLKKSMWIYLISFKLRNQVYISFVIC